MTGLLSAETGQDFPPFRKTFGGTQNDREWGRHTGLHWNPAAIQTSFHYRWVPLNPNMLKSELALVKAISLSLLYFSACFKRNLLYSKEFYLVLLVEFGGGSCIDRSAARRIQSALPLSQPPLDLTITPRQTLPLTKRSWQRQFPLTYIPNGIPGDIPHSGKLCCIPPPPFHGWEDHY